MKNNFFFFFKLSVNAVLLDIMTFLSVLLLTSNCLIFLMVLLQNSVNARYQTIPYPWLVFGEKVKVNTVFVRDSTGVSDSILILFGGALNHGVQVIHLLIYL